MTEGSPRPTSEVVAQALSSLRSTRRYDRSRQVTDEMVRGWLDVARWCGSSKNSQPWRFAVVRRPDVLEALAECGDHADHLPRSSVTIVIGMLDYPHRFSAVFDLGRVAQSLMVNAHAAGVGSCVAVFEPEHVPRVRHLLGFPDRGECNLAIGFGYPSTTESEDRSIGGDGRRALDDLVGIDRFPTQRAQPGNGS